MRKITLLMLSVFAMTSHAQNKLLSSITEYYNGIAWEKNYGYNYEFDSNNRLISEIYLQWDIDVWKIGRKVTYTYNTDNKVILEVGEDWNTTTKKLENSYKESYSYTNGKYTGQISEYWDNSNWVLEWKNAVTYNGNNLPDVAIFYDWNGSAWIASSRETLTYNANNKIDTDLEESWNNPQWVKSNKTLIAYDGSNKILNSKGANWDDFNALWTENSRIDYVLDPFGNRASSIETGDNYKYKKEYTYDGSSLMSGFAHPFNDKSGMDYLFEDFPYINKILVLKEYTFDTGTSSFKDSSRTTYNYDNAITFTTLSTEHPEIANARITISPNPTTAVVNLNFPDTLIVDKVIVTDISGKTVLNQNQNTAQINVEKLASGLYILEAYSGKEKFTSKFVKN